MARRKIIRINESMCNGCGNCIMACAEGAIRLVDGKAKVVNDAFCDGLGACIGECPTGALAIEEREAEDFDKKAAKEHLKAQEGTSIVERFAKTAILEKKICDASINRSGSKFVRHASKLGPSSQLSSWPIQMRLAHVDAPYFRDARLLIAADCTAFASPSIPEFIKGKVVLIGCPKLDETRQFVEKLADILRNNEIRDMTVLHMEVPCCSNIFRQSRRR